MDKHGGDNDKAFDGALEVDGDAPHVEDVGDDAEDEDAGKGAPKGAAAAGHGGAANDDGGNGVEFVGEAGAGGADGFKAGAKKGGTDANGEADKKIGEKFDRPGTDAGKTGDAFAGTGGAKVAAVTGAVEEDGKKKGEAKEREGG